MGEAGTCREGECVVDPLCVPYPCEDRGECVADSCDQGACSYPNAPDGSTCANGSGKCKSGVCDVDLCAQVNCDDTDDCTIGGSCNPETGKCDGSVNAPINTVCDNDSGFCDGLGSCVECNESAQCPDDANVCTAAICETGVCTAQNVEGSCSYMDGAGVCEAGVCVEAPDECDPYPCEDRGECIADSCDQSGCSYPNAPDGSTCADGSGECKSGVCDLCALVTCDDQNECTDDGNCLSNGECEDPVNVANGTPCRNGNGQCIDGACDLCAAVDCSDANQCTVDGECNPANGDCEGSGFVPINGSCNQDGGQFCNGAGLCLECNSALQCPDDGNVCTGRSCNGGECGVTAEPGECEFLPGEQGVCRDGHCVDVRPCIPYPCEDRGDCVADSCLENGECIYPNAADGVPCDNNKGLCDSGTCDWCAPVTCDDGKPCTTDGACNPANGICEGRGTLPDGTSCGVARACKTAVCIADPLTTEDFSTTDGDSQPKFFPGNDVRGLAGFYLNYTGSGVDRHVREVKPGFLPATGGSNMWAVLKDDNTDPTSWRIVTQKLPIGTTVWSKNGSSASGSPTTIDLGAIATNQVAVLRGFRVYRPGGDEHLRRIKIYVRPNYAAGRVYADVAFQDQNQDNRYDFTVAWALVPANRVLESDGHLKTTDNGGKWLWNVNEPTPILRGFDLYYGAGIDHEVDQLGVILRSTTFEAWHNDNGDTENFTVELWWARLQ